MRYLSDVNLRAVLTVLVARAGGQIDLTNEELYDAMLPTQGRSEGFELQEIASGLRLSLKSHDLKATPPTQSAGDDRQQADG